MINRKGRQPKLVSRIYEMKKNLQKSKNTTGSSEKQTSVKNNNKAITKNAEMQKRTTDTIRSQLKEIAIQSNSNVVENELRKENDESNHNPILRFELIAKLIQGTIFIPEFTQQYSLLSVEQTLRNIFYEYSEWYSTQKKDDFGKKIPELPHQLSKILETNYLLIKYRIKEGNDVLCDDFTNYDHLVKGYSIKFFRPPFNDCFKEINDFRQTDFAIEVVSNCGDDQSSDKNRVLLLQDKLPLTTLIPVRTSTQLLWKIHFQIFITLTLYEKHPPVPMENMNFPFYRAIPRQAKILELYGELLTYCTTENLLNLFKSTSRVLLVTKEQKFNVIQKCDSINLQ